MGTILLVAERGNKSSVVFFYRAIQSRRECSEPSFIPKFTALR